MSELRKIPNVGKQRKRPYRDGIHDHRIVEGKNSRAALRGRMRFARRTHRPLSVVFISSRRIFCKFRKSRPFQMSVVALER